MTIGLLNVVTAVLVFAAIFITGRKLRGIPRTRNAIVLLAHKILSLGAVTLLVITGQRVNAVAALGRGTWAALAGAGVLFVGTMAVGGWLNKRTTAPHGGRVLHRTLALLTVLVSGVSLYLLLAGG